MYPLEFIYARSSLERAGVVVVSEFSTCSSVLNGSLKINPFYSLLVADTIHKAINMSVVECDQRRQRDLNVICNHPSSEWTKQIIRDLREVQMSSVSIANDSPIKDSTPAVDVSKISKIHASLPKKFRNRTKKTMPLPLELPMILGAVARPRCVLYLPSLVDLLFYIY